ncbi:hypothetical protein E2C01_005551 [Portunus trituberculatus]|uniref:RNA-directed DNA polymerase from mobile element jockey n=1 Tax=Portunus trituberculatus TaxID=210409 RepID=A0A5B7CUM2_PORTR|nr:hypothetical protein [Portunus trituberculatus]
MSVTHPNNTPPRIPVLTTAELDSLHITTEEREDAHPPAFFLEGKRLPLQQSISILGVEVDASLTFTTHMRRVARDAAWRLSCVRRVGKLLDGSGIATLYRAQVRPVMEYAPLTWSSCPPSYLAGLDRIQARAQRMVQLRNQDQQVSFQPLQQRQDVAGLCVMYKALRQQTPHLAPLRLPPPPIPTHDTCTAGLIDHHLTVTVPFARTESHLCSFLPRYSRMWNQLRSDVTGEPCGSLCGCQGTTKFEFKSPSMHSVVRGHPTAKSEFHQAEIRQVPERNFLIKMNNLLI